MAGRNRHTNVGEVKLRGCKRRDDRMCDAREEGVEAQARQARAMQERLKQTKEPLEARAAKLSGAQTSLSTADCLSEMEVLSIVHDINESNYQVAVGLAEEWERFESSQITGQTDIDQPEQ